MQQLIIDRRKISTPLFDIIKDIKEQLFNGKLAVIKLRGDNIRVTCPHHKNGLERTPAADVYIGDSDNVQYGTFRCFVCGEQGPFYHFVAECFDKSDAWAKKWLIDNYADSTIEYELELPEISIEKPEQKTTVDEEELNKFESFHPYLTKRKLTKSVCEKFEVKYDTKSKCIVFPVRDEYGNLMMFTRRSVENKMFIIDESKQKPVYLLYYLKKKDIQTCFITESQINALTLYTYGLPAVALLGTGSAHQYDILNRSGIRYYILCFDGDDAGNKGIKNFLTNIRKDVLVDVVRMPRGKDINDLTKEEFFQLLDKNMISYDQILTKYKSIV